MAGMIAAFNSVAGGSLGAPHNLFYNNASRYIRDVTIGNTNVKANGAYSGGYEATTGWDAATGLGSVKFDVLYTDYVSSTLTNITVATVSGRNLPLIPTFNPTDTINVSYGTTVSNTVTSVIITPFSIAPNQTIKVGGNLTTSGSPVQIDGLAIGPYNQIPVTVQSFNGQHTTNYVINITREAALSTDATLASLYLAATTDTTVSPILMTLSPSFATTITSYVSTVTNAYQFVGLNPSANDAGIHSVVVNLYDANNQLTSVPVTPNTYSGPIFYLTTGSNTFRIVATAGDLITKKTYDVLVYRLNTIGTTASVVPPTIYPPIHWITTNTNLGTITGGTFTTNVRATGTDTQYSVISGSLPNYLNLTQFAKLYRYYGYNFWGCATLRLSLYRNGCYKSV
jgi:hypothetical protein